MRVISRSDLVSGDRKWAIRGDAPGELLPVLAQCQAALAVSTFPTATHALEAWHRAPDPLPRVRE